MPEQPAIMWQVRTSDWLSLWVRRPLTWLVVAVVVYVGFLGVDDILSGDAVTGGLILLIGPALFALLLGYRVRQFARLSSHLASVTPTEAGLKIEARSVHITYDWPCLSAREGRLGVVICDDDGRPIVMIPWRAFSDRSSGRKFAELVLKRGSEMPSVA
jgi:hypothetical protein